MSGLILKLGPREKVLINGAVVENGEKRSRLSIKTRNASILRLRDTIHPEDANTPVKRVCYIAQLVLSGDMAAEQAKLQILRRIEELSRVLADKDSLGYLDTATHAVESEDYYRCLKSLRALLPREQRLLSASIQ